MTDFVGRYGEHVERLAQAVLTTTGDTDAALRQSVEVRAGALGGRTTVLANEIVPATVDRYVDNVALHAHKVTDTDVETLEEAGYSEDAIFEITLSAALGAALGRLDRGLAALRGSRS